MNFTLPDKREKDDRWIEEVRATADFLALLHVEFGRNFAIAIHDRERGFNEDVAFVGRRTPEFATIIRMIEAHRM